MTSKLKMTAAALLIFGASLSTAAAADTTTVYGSQLMTQQERLEYRSQMRTLRTPEERAAFRQEHHKKMQERAKEKGVTLPDAPPAMGGGAGPGAGPGMGGMGPGGGRGR